MAGPLSQVLDALQKGAVSRAEIARHTGLAAPTVDAAMAHLETMGKIKRRPLNAACAGGCGGCPSHGACTAGPVALVLGKR